MFFCLHDNSRSCYQILMKFFGWVECVTRNSELDFGSDPDHDAESGIFKEIFIIADYVQFSEFCWLLKKLPSKFFLEVWYFTSNKPFDFVANPHHNQDPGFLTEFLQQQDRASCKNFAGSIAQFALTINSNACPHIRVPNMLMRESYALHHRNIYLAKHVIKF